MVRVPVGPGWVGGACRLLSFTEQRSLLSLASTALPEGFVNPCRAWLPRKAPGGSAVGLLPPGARQFMPEVVGIDLGTTFSVVALKATDGVLRPQMLL